MTQSPANTLRQIVMDMHEIATSSVVRITEPQTAKVAEAVRALAEAILSIDAQAKLAASRAERKE